MNFTFSRKTSFVLAAAILMAATNALAQDEPTLFDPETLLGDNPYTSETESPIADGEQQGIFRYEGGGFYSYEYYTRPSIDGLVRPNMRDAVPAFYSSLAIPKTASPVEIIEAVPGTGEHDFYCRRPGFWDPTMEQLLARGRAVSHTYNGQLGPHGHECRD